MGRITKGKEIGLDEVKRLYELAPKGMERGKRGLCLC